MRKGGEKEEEGRERELDNKSIGEKRSKRKTDHFMVHLSKLVSIHRHPSVDRCIQFTNALVMDRDMIRLQDQLVPADLVGKTYISNEQLTPPPESSSSASDSPLASI
jgi:hypothetical protein